MSGQRSALRTVTLGAAPRARVKVADVPTFLATGPSDEPHFSLVFLDPPFHQGLVESCCARLEQVWLTAEAWIYVESETGEPDIENIEDDDEYDAAADAFDEILDDEEFDED